MQILFLLVSLLLHYLEKRVIRLLISSVLLADLASYLRYSLTGSMRVDQNHLEGLNLWLFLVPAIVSVSLALYVLQGIVLNKKTFKLSARETRFMAWTCSILALPMLPMFSNDMFSLFAYGDLLQQGINPYTEYSQLNQSMTWFPFVGDLYTDFPSCYGPYMLYILWFIAWATGAGFWGSIVIFKIMTLLSIGLLIETGYAYFKKFPNGQFNTLALLLLNPLVWLEGAGQNHNDIFGIGFLMLSLWLLRNGKASWAYIAILVPCLIKFSYVILLPLPVLYVFLSNGKNVIGTLKTTLPGIVGFLVIGALMYYPVWDGPGALTIPYTTASGQNPSSSAPDVIGELAAQLGTATGQIREGEELAYKKGVWGIFIPMFKLFAFFLIALLAWKYRKIKNPEDLIFAFGQFAVIMLCFFTHRVFPWYGLLALPLFLEARHRDWLLWMGLAFPFMIFQGIIHTPYDSSLPDVILTIISIFGGVVLFFWRLKSRVMYLN